MISAEWVDTDRAELRADGAPGVLVCEYSGVTGEWTIGEFRLHDGGTLSPDDLPPCFSLNAEELDALEGLA